MRLTAAPVLAALMALPAVADEATFPATLKGHVVLPALTLTAPPADAPADAAVSGKFTLAARVMEPETVMGDTGAAHGKRETGLKLPFRGQPVQGFSGYAMTAAEDGAVWMLTDNGFGTKANSPDALLMVHKMVPHWDSGAMELTETVFLHDPDMKVPFRIAYEGAGTRYLTGADFDTESVQYLNGELWIGDEFGPYLLRVATDGKILAVYPTKKDGAEIKGADTPGISATSVAGKDWVVQRSGGYEGMALQPGTNLLWAMFEKRCWVRMASPRAASCARWLSIRRRATGPAPASGSRWPRARPRSAISTSSTRPAPW